MPTISCAMIVRDCEKTLERALQSVRPYVDELVIVDTGSVDGTCDLALKYADMLIGYRWDDHFAKARQYALDHCSGDWVIWLDADDQLMGGEHLRRLAEEAPDDLGFYLLRYVTDVAADGSAQTDYWRERLVRRGIGGWKGRVHEVLDTPPGTRHLRHADVWVLHHGHGDHFGSKQRNIRLLEKSLEEDPDNTRTLFYLGRDLVVTGSLDRGADVLEHYLDVGTWADELFIAQGLVGYVRRAQGRFDDAYAADLGLLTLKPLWPQAWFALAEDAYYMQRWDWSVHFCEIGQRCPPPITNLFTNRQHLESGWMIYQAVALYRVGRLQDAYDLTLRALERMPDNQQHRHNAAFFAQELAKNGTHGTWVPFLEPRQLEVSATP